MGYDLRRMIRDGAPDWWTPLMRDVAKEIADNARDPDDGRPRDGKPAGPDQWVDYWAGVLPLPWSVIPIEGTTRNGAWHQGLAEICGASRRAISDSLTNMARGHPGTAADAYEMRVPLTDRDGKPVTDRNGRVLFTAPGHGMRFVVPPLLPRWLRERPHHSATEAPERPHPGAIVSPGWSHHSATDGPQRPHHSASVIPERSHPDVRTVAPQCDPIPPIPSKTVPSENRSPQPPLLAVAPPAEASRAGDGDGIAIDGGGEGGRCRYAGCQRPGQPAGPGREYHADPCEGLAAMRSRLAAVKAGGGGSAA